MLAGWSYDGLPVITDMRCYWTVRESSVLFFMEERRVRLAIAEAMIVPCGRRPHSGRGRAALVFDAETLTGILASFA